MWLYIALAVLLASHVAKAQDISVIKKLSFGTIAIIDQNSAGTVTIEPNVRPQTSSNILFVKFGHAAEILLNDFPHNRQISVQSTVYNDWFGYWNLGASDAFQLTELYHENAVYTNSVGSAEFKVGGQLRFAGNGNSLSDGVQTLNVEITLSY
ncbi:DUF4402 domain-containing protein [Pseudoalteromonas sp. A757]|uniref:DUF4402 domain-containing protein n=1 Tax=Pseudoalteromonas sp. A757 TaxID=2250709 RepID=UPI001ADEA3C0|nr:DUF4402 domain-containing protein [Pseudoalteromonas sp. A757]